MSRSLGRRVILKSRNMNHEADGRAMFAAGRECPPKSADRGKEHAVWRGWQRAATEARTAASKKSKRKR